MSRKEKYEIGEMVRDKVSGYEGIVTAVTKWYNGCIRYRVEPDHLNPDGELIESETFDEEQIEKVPKKKIKVPKNRTGGGRPNDTKRAIVR